MRPFTIHRAPCRHPTPLLRTNQDGGCALNRVREQLICHSLPCSIVYISLLRTNQDGGTAATICGPRTPSTYLYFGGVYAMGSCVRHGRAEICDIGALRGSLRAIYLRCAGTMSGAPYIVAVGGRFADFIRFFFSGSKIGNRQEIGNVAKSNEIGRRFQNRLQL